MSTDLKNAKKPPGSAFPEAAIDASAGLERMEEFLTPSMLKRRFLAGIPMVLPITKEKVSDDDLIDYIKRGANEFETDAKVEVSPIKRRVRLPFDPNLYVNYLWCEVPYKPIQKVDKLFVASASYGGDADAAMQKYPSGTQIFVIPTDWIDMSYASKGRLSVNPINPALGSVTFSNAASGAGIGAIGALTQFGQISWIPAWWSVEATFGYCSEDGQVPVYVNEAIGAKAAILFLQNLFPLYRVGSHSLGIDGMSQSVGDNFQTLLQAKITMLQEQYAKSVKKIKMVTGNTGFVSNI